MDYKHGQNYVFDATSNTFHEAATSNPFNDIRQFHEKFELSYNGKPRVLDEELEEFRVGFMAEELVEYITGHPAAKFAIDYLKGGVTVRAERPPLDKQFDAL